MVLTTPLFDNLKELSPESEITVLASKSNFEIASNHKNVDETLVYSGNPFQKLALLYKLKSEKYDLWIDTKNEFSNTSKILVRFARPGKSLGFNFEEKVFDISLNDNPGGEHCTDINLSPMSFLDKEYNIRSKRPSLYIPDETDGSIVSRLNPEAERRLLINISAGKPSRQWGKKNWSELLTEFTPDDKNFDIVINAVKEDYEMANELVEAHKQRLNIYTLQLTLMETCSVIRHSDYVISPDTAVIHIASAYNKPLVGLYTNVDWNNKKFAPLTDKYKMLVSDNENSLSSITAGEVYKAFTAIKEENEA